MPNINIIKKTNVEKTFRVAKIMSDFDLKVEHSSEKFNCEFELPNKWKIGAIVGPSGSGKTVISKNIFENNYIKDFKYSSKSIIDDMPQDKTVKEISKIFYSVGLGSVPSWLKPYKVLSQGEKMRVNLARAILENDFIVFDEFTSVVDRNVAKTASIAVNKAIYRENKKFIAISCHYDILKWLQPDWVFDTNNMKYREYKKKDPKEYMKSMNAQLKSGKNLGNITI